MNEASEQPNYYAIIPANVRYDKRLIQGAKLLYGEITALSNQKGYCWATDGYFLKLYAVSKSTIQNWLKSLEDCGYISRDVIYKKDSPEIENRYIRILAYPIPENRHTPIPENYTDNNTSINTTININDDDTHAREENNPYTFYQQNIGVMNPITSDSISMWLADFIKQGTPTKDEAAQIVNLAITKASDQGVRKWAYVNGILKDWSTHNLVTLANIKASDQEHEANKKSKPSAGQPKRKQLWTNDSFTDDDIGF